MVNLPEKYSFVQRNPEFDKALELIVNSKQHLNIIGPAGVGKTLLLKMVCDKDFLKGNTVVLSSTGIAAVNASSEGIIGSTIHSFFKFKPLTIYSSNMIRIIDDLSEVMNNVDTLIIDEISMVNASLFDFMIETLIRYRSKQMQNIPRIILFGDILQLPPVIDLSNADIKKYFNILYNDKYMYFNSMSFSDLGFQTVHLNTIYRQSDTSFQNILNRIRQATHTQDDLNFLNQYVIPEEDYFDKHELYLSIATTNKTVDLINKSNLDMINSTQKDYHIKMNGSITYEDIKNTGIPQIVSIKKDLQVMCTKNGLGYSNGTLGRVVSFNNDEVCIITKEGKYLNIPRVDWKIYNYTLSSAKELKESKEEKENRELKEYIDYRNNTETSEEKEYREHLEGKETPEEKEIREAEEKIKASKFALTKKKGPSITAKELGSVSQIALKGASALTAHKTQGQTISDAYIDLENYVFAEGLTYVALSRLKSLDGLGLKRKIRMNDIRASKESLEFLSNL